MKYIVPLSGGKDSQAVVKKAVTGNLDAVYVHQYTGYDHPDTYYHIKEMGDFYNIDIEFTRSKYGDMFGFLESCKYFPNSAARGCTQRLKQEPFAQWLVDKGFNENNCTILFGMRADESRTRQKKYGHLSPEETFSLSFVSKYYSQSWRKNIGNIKCLVPIVDWSTENVFNFIDKDPINKLYSKGHTRVGCYPCFLGRKDEWIAAGKDPHGKKVLNKLLGIEREWKDNNNPRKFIKVHRTWDVSTFIED